MAICLTRAQSVRERDKCLDKAPKSFAILNHKCIMSQVVVFQLVLRLNRTIDPFCCNHSNSNQNNDTINTKRSMRKASSVCKATVFD